MECERGAQRVDFWVAQGIDVEIVAEEGGGSVGVDGEEVEVGRALASGGTEGEREIAGGVRHGGGAVGGESGTPGRAGVDDDGMDGRGGGHPAIEAQFAADCMGEQEVFQARFVVVRVGGWLGAEERMRGELQGVGFGDAGIGGGGAERQGQLGGVRSHQEGVAVGGCAAPGGKAEEVAHVHGGGAEESRPALVGVEALFPARWVAEPEGWGVGGLGVWIEKGRFGKPSHA